MKFGVLKYDYGISAYTIGDNLGDEIQSIAASYFLPKIDYFIDRENITQKLSNEKIKLIMNGWYMHDHKQWPPASNIDPLLISVNLSNTKFVKNLFLSKNRNYLYEHGPIGARDLHTLKILQEQNIPSYFSGCLTLTLPKNKFITKQDYILCIDVAKPIVEKLKKNTNKKIFEFSSNFSRQYLNCSEKFKYAFGLLKAYQSAYCVVTSRLHAAMPCLALETPVLLVRNFEKNDSRFDGLGELVQKADDKFYLNNLDYFDINNPPPNSNKYVFYRQNLIQKCELFTGCKHRTTSPIFQINSLEEQFITNLEIIYNLSERESANKFSHYYFKKRLAKIKRNLYFLR